MATPAPITSIQPGGGLGPWLLRLLGGPPLAWFRNVCPIDQLPHTAYLFTPHPLRLARAGLAEAAFFSLLFGGPAILFVILALNCCGWYWLPGVVVLVLWLFELSFFRDPERVIPPDADALVSPADGTITDVGEVEEPDFPGGRAFRIGMFLSVFNVHVNRLPRSGRVLGIRYYPGRFLDARAAGCEKVNEQLWIDLGEEGAGRLVRVKQISGKIARRIVCWLRPGEHVEKGVRLGMIKFGSRTEVYLPCDAVREVLVKAGDKVKGGATILLRVTAV
jgi:phosphatidylserine decarboxylase